MTNWIQKQLAGWGWERGLSALMLAVAGVFYALYFLHLQADFPNNSPWMDWAKYTDEGWYGNAAIEHFVRGHWYVAGDFNPGVALPVWPAVEGVVFKFTGVSLGAARALAVLVFGGTLAAVWFLMRRFHSAAAASLAVLLMAVSPFCYAFSRLAILEPMLVFLMLLALLAASFAEQGRWWPVAALGILIPVMVLTKTTAIFLMPAVFFLLPARLHGRLWVFLRQAGAAAGLAAAIWGGYYALLVRPHYLADYQYLFSANTYTGITLGNFWSVLGETLKNGMWMDVVLYPAFAVVVLAVVVGACWDRLRWLRRHVLMVTALAWAGGYFGFLAYHNNMQPRYFLVIAVPMLMAIAIGAESCWLWVEERRRAGKAIRWRWAVAGACGVVLAVAVGTDARLTLHFVRRPEYSFLDAARQVREIIDADPGVRAKARSRLVMSISGNDLTLMTGVPSICDDFGTMELEDRIAAYRPGWYVSWNLVEDDKQEALDKYYRLERVAEIPAMDDPERNLLILYRLEPRNGVVPAPVRHRRRPHLLETGLDSIGPDVGWERIGMGRLGTDFSGLNAAEANRSIQDYGPDYGAAKETDSEAVSGAGNGSVGKPAAGNGAGAGTPPGGTVEPAH